MPFSVVPVSSNTLSHIFSVNTGEKMHHNAQICKLNFKKISGGYAPGQTPMLGRSYGAPPQTPRTPSALRRFAPTAPRSGSSASPSFARSLRHFSFYNLTTAN